MPYRLTRFLFLPLIFFAGCATTYYYDENGKELVGLPFVWKDEKGKARLAYVKTSTGFGQATFTLERNEAGGYTRVTSNLDSTAAAQLTGDVLDRAFEAGKRAARIEMRERISNMDDASTKSTLLKKLEELEPEK